MKQRARASNKPQETSVEKYFGGSGVSSNELFLANIIYKYNIQHATAVYLYKCSLWRLLVSILQE